jgi:aldehyde dehydrogenase (NAD+)
VPGSPPAGGGPTGFDTRWYVEPTLFADVARRIRIGAIGVNRYMLDVSAPVGGYKGSGIGREMGPEGLDNYVELKSITLIGV